MIRASLALALLAASTAAAAQDNRIVERFYDAGKVVRIAFDSGDRVAAGDVLVQLDVSQETAQLRALEAGENLARVNLKRMEALLARLARMR